MPKEKTEARNQASAATGIEGLDNVLAGGFAPRQLYLIEGVPGSGKTTLALQFLLEGLRQKESVLYITLSESREELLSAGESHGWDLRAMPVHEMIPSRTELMPDEQYTMFHPSEVEMSETSKAIQAEVERVKPTRVILDSLSELRLIAGTALRFRRQILALKQYLTSQGCTVLLLDDQSGDPEDIQLQSMAHGVVALQQVHLEYGAERRRLRVTKFRGRNYRTGYHDYLIRTGGVQVYPRLVAAEHRHEPSGGKFCSGLAEFDQLLGGGIDQGTSTLLLGAPGTGKSTLASQFVSAAADRGECSAMFIFDETVNTLLMRADGLGMSLRKHWESGLVTIQQVDPAEMSPGEFVHTIRMAAESGKVKMVVIDSMNGYLNAMPGERHLTIQLHELLSFLGQQGVSTILVSAQQGLIGSQMQSPVDASYLADTIVMLRYFENGGEIHQALSVVKKRSGAHERTIREFSLDSGRITVGEPLREFRGVLTGVPVYQGSSEALTDKAFR